MSDIEGKCFTTSDYNKFTDKILDVKIKDKKLVNKSDIINSSDLEKKIKKLATKAELKAEQDKIVKLKTYDFYWSKLLYQWWITKSLNISTNFQHFRNVSCSCRYNRRMEI